MEESIKHWIDREKEIQIVRGKSCGFSPDCKLQELEIRYPIIVRESTKHLKNGLSPIAK
jgi:hypothetical protein